MFKEENGNETKKNMVLARTQKESDHVWHFAVSFDLSD